MGYEWAVLMVVEDGWTTMQSKLDKEDRKDKAKVAIKKKLLSGPIS